MYRFLLLSATTAAAFVFSAAPVAVSEQVDHGPSGFSTGSAYASLLEPAKAPRLGRDLTQTHSRT